MTDLLEIAAATRLRAPAPYSNFLVGAALRSTSGKVFSGCNVENVSLGLTMCAERVCIGSAVAAGENEFTDIGIVSDSEQPIVPCGACRQVLAEFNPTLRIYSRTVGGLSAIFNLGELLPKCRDGILSSST